MKKILPVVAAAALAAGTVTVALPAQAGPIQTVFFCNGEADDGITLDGSLVVRAGQSCTLSNTEVTGNVTVRAGGDLVFSGGSVGGRLSLQNDAFVDAEGVAVAGNFVSANGYGAYLVDSSVGGNARGTADDSDVEPFFYAIGTDLAGNATFDRGDLLFETASVAGNVAGNGTAFTDVIDTVIDGTITVTDNELGGTFVDSEVYGDASYTGNGFVLQIGADGPITPASGQSVWGGNVTITDNTADLYIDNNIVRGDVTLTGNTGVLTLGENNRIRGEVITDAPADATVAPKAAPDAQLRTLAAAPEAAEVPVERQAEVKGDVVERKAAALAKAAAAGPANIG